MVCNSGVGLSPLVNAKVHHFGHRGLFNGLSILGDKETCSYWDHMTGRCVHGPLKDYQLEISPLIHTDVGTAVRSWPDAQLAVSRQTLPQRLMGWCAERTRLWKRGFLPPGFRGTMGKGDPRLPRMEIGLGIWSDSTRRFYALQQVRDRGGWMVDQFDGRSLLVMVDASTRSPMAFFVDVRNADWQGSSLVLDSGLRIRDGIVTAEDGQRVQVEQPLQVFTRWYGFSFTFPGCEVRGPVAHRLRDGSGGPSL